MSVNRRDEFTPLFVHNYIAVGKLINTLICRPTRAEHYRRAFNPVVHGGKLPRDIRAVFIAYNAYFIRRRI